MPVKKIKIREPSDQTCVNNMCQQTASTICAYTMCLQQVAELLCQVTVSTNSVNKIGQRTVSKKSESTGCH